MSTPRRVLLTGATGLLGRYLLRDLLLAGRPVAVLARDGRQGRAADRIAEILDFWSETLTQPLPRPTVLAGDLCLPDLGLTLADRRWLAEHCGAVVHAAAHLGFRATPDGEPWRTNVEGTQALYRLCGELGLSEWHHVSTAFVCGRRGGTVREEELDCGQAFHNPYEQSKFAAESWLRGAGARVTVYRPSVIVGDSGTGYTSNYAGFYRFLELAVRLARANAPSADGPRRLPLRLPLSGEERWDLVPVDWVARAVVELMGRPLWHGHTLHLVSRAPLVARFLRDVAAEELQVEGVELVGPNAGAQAGPQERRFLEGLQEYWPYLAGTPAFARTNTAAALPHLPPPPLDRAVLARLIRHAVADRWGRRGPERRRETEAPAGRSRCARYVEEIFPQQARRSRLARRAGLNLTVGLDVGGRGGGQWSCRWTDGELTYVARGLEERAAVTYRTDADTFDAILQGRLSPQQAFFDERLAIAGDLETALKLAVLFAQFLRENPCPAPQRTEALDATHP